MKHKVEIIQLQKVLENGSEQHLYVTVPQAVEKIKEGDYYYWPVTKTIIKHKEIVKGETPSKDGRKIIATTDSKLKLKVVDYNARKQPKYNPISEDFSGKTRYKRILIPQLQQLFIKEFVANPKGEYEVEYIQLFSPDGNNWCTTDNKGWSQSCDKKVINLNQDNTVNITAVEKKMYSELDLKIILCTYSGDSAAKVFKWVKKNL